MEEAQVGNLEETLREGAHVTLFRPALPFLSGRCGCASQHKVFRNTTSFSDRPLFNTLFPADSVRICTFVATPGQGVIHTTHSGTVAQSCGVQQPTLQPSSVLLLRPQTSNDAALAGS